jgi:hypothetical protein
MEYFDPVLCDGVNKKKKEISFVQKKIFFSVFSGT